MLPPDPSILPSLLGPPPPPEAADGISRWAVKNPPKDPTLSFAGKTVLVTGSNTGLGYEAALKFAVLPLPPPPKTPHTKTPRPNTPPEPRRNTHPRSPHALQRRNRKDEDISSNRRAQHAYIGSATRHVNLRLDPHLPGHSHIHHPSPAHRTPERRARGAEVRTIA
ncbi:hypothetical protein M7I_2884 [Glarea lozoyensis 74030]|uniref:Uncharacterized protein n=1 Tax=Glarea lozoyensis (strain ATCC 74030 / MF5533) TaxID=1104152 RepID=H0EK00_GLAL7|nr:hypothetical protein M7I_2884 [Glarea lozoyensis 74030]